MDVARNQQRSQQLNRPHPVGSFDPRGNRGWIFAAVWLAYLIPTLQTAFRLDDPARRVAGVVLVLAFGVSYVGVFVYARNHRWRADAELPLAVQVAIIAGMSALTVLGCLLIGEDGTALIVYLAVTAVLVLPTRIAWATALLLIVVVEVAARTVPGWQNDDGGLGFSIFLAALAVWGIGQMIARNRQLALAHEEITQLAIAQERNRFSRDLHDLLGHSLTVITVKTELAGRLIGIDPARAEREIADVERLARDALADVRSAVAGYREVSLAGELSSAQSALEAAGIAAEIPTALDDVPGERRELFGWAVREGVTNVLRHSGASHCRISVTRSAVQIEDDGSGPAEPDLTSAAAPAGGGPGFGSDELVGQTGSGLAGLRERADAVGARVWVGRADGGGFRLRVGW